MANSYFSFALPGETGNVVIIDIYFIGAGSQNPDECIEIRNDDTKSIQMHNWTLSDAANQLFTFPSFVMEPGKVCRINTNEYHPEWYGFSDGSSSTIWNNTGDTAYLRDGNGTLIDEYGYLYLTINNYIFRGQINENL